MYRYYVCVFVCKMENNVDMYALSVLYIVCYMGEKCVCESSTVGVGTVADI